jgi:hypothetical protein
MNYSKNILPEKSKALRKSAGKIEKINQNYSTKHLASNYQSSVSRAIGSGKNKRFQAGLTLNLEFEIFLT